MGTVFPSAVTIGSTKMQGSSRSVISVCVSSFLVHIGFYENGLLMVDSGCPLENYTFKLLVARLGVL